MLRIGFAHHVEHLKLDHSLFLERPSYAVHVTLDPPPRYGKDKQKLVKMERKTKNWGPCPGGFQKWQRRPWTQEASQIGR